MRDENSGGGLKSEYLNEPYGDDRKAGDEKQIMTEKTKLMCLLPVIIFVLKRRVWNKKDHIKMSMTSHFCGVSGGSA